MIIKVYCSNCKQVTKHREKLDTFLGGKVVCNICDSMNNKVSLIRKLDGLIKTSRAYKFLEFGANGTCIKSHDKIKVGYSLILSPFNPGYIWQTTLITKILKKKKGYIQFETQNSSYELFYTK